MIVNASIWFARHAIVHRTRKSFVSSAACPSSRRYAAPLHKLLSVIDSFYHRPKGTVQVLTDCVDCVKWHLKCFCTSALWCSHTRDDERLSAHHGTFTQSVKEVRNRTLISSFFEQNIFHGSMSLDQLYLARPLPSISDYRAPIKGLYLCGSGSHPGWFLFVNYWTAIIAMHWVLWGRVNAGANFRDSLAFHVYLFILCLSFSCRGWSDGLPRLECGTNCHCRPKTQLKQFNKHSFIIVNSSLESCPSTTTCHPSCFTKHSDRKEEAKVWAVAEQVVVIDSLRYITRKQHKNQNTRYNTLCFFFFLNVSLIL